MRLFRLLIVSLVISVNHGAVAEILSKHIRPAKVVSANLCTDELLLLLAEPEQIASVTWLVKDPQLSWYADQAKEYPSNRGLAEEILQQQPDLVLAATYTAPSTLAMLKRFNVPVLVLPQPRSLAELGSQIGLLGRALGQVEKAQRVLADMSADLSALPAPKSSAKPTAALFQPNGLTATRGTLIDDVLQHAGLVNLAVLRELPNYAQLPLEVVVRDQPDLLIMNSYRQRAPSLAQELLQHPILRRAFSPSRIVTVPSQAWTCASPHVVSAIRTLRTAVLRAEATL